jgi:hypothetical protein
MYANRASQPGGPVRYGRPPTRCVRAGALPWTPAFYASVQGWLLWIREGEAGALPGHPASELALRSHPCVALSSAPAIGEFSSILREETQ